MEAISSASDIDLEDGEIIDDSDSDLSIFSIKDLKQPRKEKSSTSKGSGISLFPLSSPLSKENKKADHDKFNLIIKIPGLADTSKSNEDRPRHRAHRHHRRKKTEKIYEDWTESIDLLTSPKKRKKTASSAQKYSSCESLSSEWRSSKKTCIEPKLSPVRFKENPLLAKLVRTGDISPSNIVLKEKNGGNEKPVIINQLSDVSSDELIPGRCVKSPMSALSDVSSDDVISNKGVKNPSILHAKLSDTSSDELAAHYLITKDFKCNRQNLKKSPSGAEEISHCKLSSDSLVDDTSKTSEVSVQIDTCKENGQISENVSKPYLMSLKDASENEVYSPETFTPFDYETLQDSETLELRAALAERSDFVSENYDCIPMSCSEDEDASSVDSKSEHSEDSKQHQQDNDPDSEEDEVLRLRISALKTWLQRKYGKSKSQKKTASVDEGVELPKSDQVENSVENVVSPHMETNELSHSPKNQAPVAAEGLVSLSLDVDASCKEREGTKADKSEEVAVNNEDDSAPAGDNSLIDEEASENYEQALRSLLVSNLLKKKLKNSNELLTESTLINKASSSLISKPPGKTSSTASNVSDTSHSSKVTVNTKYRTVNSTKNSKQNTNNSVYKPGCDSFQSKYVFNNFYEPPNQVDDSKYLSSLSNFKLPVVEKFVIHLSEDSDYDSDESKSDSAPEPTLDKKSAGPCERRLEKSAIKPPMVVPNQKYPSNTTAKPLPTHRLVNASNEVLSSRRVAPKTQQLSAETVSRKVTTSSMQVQRVSSESMRGKPIPQTASSPRKVVSNSVPVSLDGSTPRLQAPVESANKSSSPNAKDKLRKANSALIADVLVPVEKKLLKSRLNLLQKLDSMQGCVSSCEENASNCAKSFAKIVQLQKALKLATVDYKTHFKSLKSCLQSYQVQSQGVSSNLSEYAQAQKDCERAGKQVLGPNYKAPNEGMSAMATKFKLMKAKKLELLNKASIANEIKKANFSSDASSATISAALKNITESKKQALPEKSKASNDTPSFTVTDTDKTDTSKGGHSGGVVSSGAQPDPVKTVIEAPRVTNSPKTSAPDSLPSEKMNGPKTLDREMDPSTDSCSTETKSNSTTGEENTPNKDETRPAISTPPPIPESLMALLQVMDGENLEGACPIKCQQKFTKYTPVYPSLSRGSNGDRYDSVNSILCPFSLQGTCRDETCKYKHLPN